MNFTQLPKSFPKPPRIVPYGDSAETKKDLVKDKYNYHDYEVINNLFTDFNLKTLSINNFLTEDENRRLFISKNIHEITYLIMNGLNKAFI